MQLRNFEIDRQRALVEYSKKSECIHPNRELRKRTVAGGQVQYVRQCVQCGQATLNPLAKAAAIAENGGTEPALFDNSLKDQWQMRLDAGRKEIIGEHGSREQFEQQEFFVWYDEYLKSSEWKLRRDLVIARANNKCEGCQRQPASSVHHRTYEHVGAEFLFELVAVCAECHDRLHAV